MDDMKRTQEMFGQLASKTVEAMTVWADANQRVLRELVEFSAATAKEGVRLCAELQQGAIEVLRDSQTAAARWQDGTKDPMSVCQKALSDSVDGAQRVFKLFEGQAQAFSRSAERIQTSAEQAGKGIQATYTTVATKMRDVYRPQN